MGLEEIVGFIISLLAFAFVFGKQLYDAYKRRKDSEEEGPHQPERKDAALHNFLKSLQVEMGEEEEERKPRSFRPPARTVPPIPKKAAPRIQDVPRTVKDDFHYQAKLDSFQQKSAVQQRQMKTNIDDRYTIHPLGEDVISADMRIADAAHKKDTLEAYDIVKSNEMARGKRVLLSTHSRQNLMIIHEIFSKPKGLQ